LHFFRHLRCSRRDPAVLQSTLQTPISARHADGLHSRRDAASLGSA
jgi:hypothetical protein